MDTPAEPSDKNKQGVEPSSQDSHRYEHSLVGLAIGEARDLICEPKSKEDAKAHAEQNDQIGHVAVDVLASLPCTRALTAAAIRGAALLDPAASFSSNVGSFAVNGAEGFALNKAVKLTMDGTLVSNAIKEKLGTGLAGEVGSHLVAGAAFSAVRAGFDKQTWTDGNGNVSLSSGALKFAESTAVGSLINVPAGMAGFRVAKAIGSNLVENSMSRVLSGTVAGATAGGVYNFTDSYVRTNDLAESGKQFLIGTAIGAAMGGVGTGVHEFGNAKQSGKSVNADARTLRSPIEETVSPSQSESVSPSQSESVSRSQRDAASPPQSESVSQSQRDVASPSKTGTASAERTDAKPATYEKSEFEIPANASEEEKQLYLRANEMIRFEAKLLNNKEAYKQAQDAVRERIGNTAAMILDYTSTLYLIKHQSELTTQDMQGIAVHWSALSGQQRHLPPAELAEHIRLSKELFLQRNPAETLFEGSNFVKRLREINPIDRLGVSIRWGDMTHEQKQLPAEELPALSRRIRALKGGDGIESLDGLTEQQIAKFGVEGFTHRLSNSVEIAKELLDEIPSLRPAIQASPDALGMLGSKFEEMLENSSLTEAREFLDLGFLDQAAIDRTLVKIAKQGQLDQATRFALLQGETLESAVKRWADVDNLSEQNSVKVIDKLVTPEDTSEPWAANSGIWENSMRQGAARFGAAKMLHYYFDANYTPHDAMYAFDKILQMQ
ncbi:MAG TPA: hypothetical protein V6C76_13270 [Drouetiella sp.]